MKKLLLAAVIAAVSASGAFAQTVVRMGTEGAYEPYNFINDKGEIDGFERELGDKLCATAGYKCAWVKNDWDSIIPNLLSGNYDVIMAGMSITEERRQKIDFTQDYYPPTVSAYVALNGAKEDVIKGNIAAQVNTIQAGYIAESKATLIEFAIADETVAAVRKGEANAVFADKEYLQKIVEESKGELVFIGPEIPLGKGVGMGIRKSDAAMRDKFDAGIAAMKKDGSLNALIAKWFPGVKVIGY